jgi:hypothetical protein
MGATYRERGEGGNKKILKQFKAMEDDQEKALGG